MNFERMKELKEIYEREAVIASAKQYTVEKYIFILETAIKTYPKRVEELRNSIEKNDNMQQYYKKKLDYLTDEKENGWIEVEIKEELIKKYEGSARPGQFYHGHYEVDNIYFDYQVKKLQINRKALCDFCDKLGIKYGFYDKSSYGVAYFRTTFYVPVAMIKSIDNFDFATIEVILNDLFKYKDQTELKENQSKTEIVNKIIEKIKLLPNNTETSISSLLAEMFQSRYKQGIYNFDNLELTNRDMFDINEAVIEKVNEENIELDYSKFEGQDVGLPFNILFVKKLNKN